jgi:hypothetical protein
LLTPRVLQLEEIFRSLELTISEEELASVVDELDRNKDDSISFDGELIIRPTMLSCCPAALHLTMLPANPELLWHSVLLRV